MNWIIFEKKEERMPYHTLLLYLTAMQTVSKANGYFVFFFFITMTAATIRTTATPRQQTIGIT